MFAAFADLLPFIGVSGGADGSPCADSEGGSAPSSLHHRPISFGSSLHTRAGTQSTATAAGGVVTGTGWGAEVPTRVRGRLYVCAQVGACVWKAWD